jgi:hypothetical protein
MMTEISRIQRSVTDVSLQRTDVVKRMRLFLPVVLFPFENEAFICHERRQLCSGKLDEIFDAYGHHMEGFH